MRCAQYSSVRPVKNICSSLKFCETTWSFIWIQVTAADCTGRPTLLLQSRHGKHQPLVFFMRILCAGLCFFVVFLPQSLKMSGLCSQQASQASFFPNLSIAWRVYMFHWKTAFEGSCCRASGLLQILRLDFRKQGRLLARNQSGPWGTKVSVFI